MGKHSRSPATVVIPWLAPIITGELKAFAHTLAPADDLRPSIPAAAFLDPATMDRLLDASAEYLGAGDRRAQTSLWCIEYVHALMPLPVVASLRLGRALPLRLEDVSVILDEEHLPSTVRLRDDGGPCTDRDPFARFDGMIRGNLEPLIDAWAAYSGISPRVLWTNAANLYEAIMRYMEKQPHAPREVIAEADMLITRTQWPDGRRNPFARPVLYRPEHPSNQRWRRVCCVRYLIPAHQYCSNCPHLLAGEEKTRRTKASPAA